MAAKTVISEVTIVMCRQGPGLYLNINLDGVLVDSVFSNS